MKINRCQYCNKSDCQWHAEAKIYKELENPTWNIDERFAEKLVKRSGSLPRDKKGIPVLNDEGFSGCVLTKCENMKLTTTDGVILLYNGNVIELKHDKDRMIENAILKSAPDDIYRRICQFL